MDLAREDVPTCHLADRAVEVENRLQAGGWELCVVVNDERVVLGLFHQGTPIPGDRATVEQMMESGPKTIRPDWARRDIAAYMQEQEMDNVLVTTSDGELRGILFRSDAERRLPPAHAATDRSSHG